MWGFFPPQGRGLLERWEKSEPVPPRLLPKENCLVGRNGKNTSRQPFPARPLQAQPVPGLTWTWRRSWRGQGRGAGSHQEEGSTWAVLACRGQEQGNVVSILAKMGKRVWEERMRNKGQEIGVRTGRKLWGESLSLGLW